MENSHSNGKFVIITLTLDCTDGVAETMRRTKERTNQLPIVPVIKMKLGASETGGELPLVPPQTCDSPYVCKPGLEINRGAHSRPKTHSHLARMNVVSHLEERTQTYSFLNVTDSTHSK